MIEIGVNIHRSTNSKVLFDKTKLWVSLFPKHNVRRGPKGHQRKLLRFIPLKKPHLSLTHHSLMHVDINRLLKIINNNCFYILCIYSTFMIK